MCGVRTPPIQGSRRDDRRCPEPRWPGPLSPWWSSNLTVARIAERLGVAWNTANDAVLAEGKRVLIADPARFDGVAVVGVDEHVVRHEALLFRMEVRDRHRLAVAAAG